MSALSATSKRIYRVAARAGLLAIAAASIKLNIVRLTRSHVSIDMFLTAHIFEEREDGDGGVGHFWGVFETRDYMRARYAHVEALMEVESFEAIKAPVDHCLDMHR